MNHAEAGALPGRRHGEDVSAGNDAAVAWLDGLAGRGMKLRLDAMRSMLAEMGNPQDALRVVHVGGTNGKGSVAAVASAILREAGHRVGTYTSPHLVRLEERILVDGAPIPPEALAAGVARLQPVVARAEAAFGLVTYFEALTLLAYWWFAESHVDVAVVEVGMGGRLDATNVHARPVVTVVTNVTLEHTQYLGKTAAEIAAEKAEILRPGVPVLTAAEDDALAVVVEKAAALGSPVTVYGRDLLAETVEATRERQEILVLGTRREYPPLATALVGRHQLANVALAVAACEQVDAAGLAVPPEAVVHGVAAARWPGRLQWLRKRPALLLDGAHNPAGAEALAAFLEEHRIEATFLFGCLDDKDWGAMVRALAPFGKRAVVVAPPSERALDPRDLASAFARANVFATTAPDVERALLVAREQAGEDGVVVATGSLYLVGEVLRLLGEPGV